MQVEICPRDCFVVPPRSDVIASEAKQSLSTKHGTNTWKNE